MAQYDLLLTQNVAAAGTEFSEKYVHLNKGELLTADTNHVPTVLAAGTDTYILTAHADVANGTGLEWVIQSAGHTQNTDTGTTGSTFDIDSDGTTNGVRLKAATGVLELKNLADDAYAALVSGGLTVNGNFTVNGTTTTLNAVTLTVDDKNLELGSVAAVTGVSGTISDAAATMTGMSTTVGLIPGMTLTKASGTGAFTGTPTIVSVDSATQITMSANAATSGAIVTDFGGVTDVTADGGGITLKGATDKTILWDNANDNWTLNQNVNIPSGTVYKINNSTVLSSTQVLGVTLGTMAAETATNYITKATYNANTILIATSDDTPTPLTVGASTVVGRKATGDIVALAPSDLSSVLFVAAPADKIGTGITSVIGQVAYDSNFFYLCTQSGASASSKWARMAMATNW
jgi:hypothetical protein